MSNVGDERVIEKEFSKPTSIGGSMAFGPTKVKQRLMVKGVTKVLGRDVQETKWVDVEVIQ